MRVAVVSGQRPEGKTAMSLMMVNAYPNASGRESVYVTNKSLSETLSYMRFATDGAVLERSINVVTALSATQNLSDGEILDYAYRPSATSAMLFDVYSSIITPQEAHDNFMSVINKLGNRLIVMDLSGDPHSNVVKNVMKECDIWLYCFSPDKRSVEEAAIWYNELEEEERIKAKLVCTKWNDYTSKKTFQEMMKIRANSILWFPYHRGIERLMLEGRLCLSNKLMIEGKDEFLCLRQPIKDLLSHCCDTKTLKVIKEVNQWAH